MSTAHAKHLKPVARLLREPGRNRLNSWKEIAAHLDREVRTVQRWEKREGLPVWRHFHSKASSVYAFKNEVDAWLHSRRRTIVACNTVEVWQVRLGTIGNPGVTRFSNNLEDEIKKRALGTLDDKVRHSVSDSALSFLVACRTSKCLYYAASSFGNRKMNSSVAKSLRKSDLAVRESCFPRSEHVHAQQITGRFYSENDRAESRVVQVIG